MGRDNDKSEIDELLVNDVVVYDVVPYCIKKCRYSSARQIAKNLLREYSAQRFYVEQVYRLCYDTNQTTHYSLLTTLWYKPTRF